MTCLITMLILDQAASAQTYKWIDKDGNVQFSDRAPPGQQAEEISENLPKLNIDQSVKTAPAQLERLNRAQSVREREAQATMATQDRSDERRSRICNQARKDMRILQGRVAFTDEAGNEIKVSEKERARIADQYEDQIRQYCD